MRMNDYKIYFLSDYWDLLGCVLLLGRDDSCCRFCTLSTVDVSGRNFFSSVTDYRFWITPVIGAKKWYSKWGKGFVHNWCQPSGEKCTYIVNCYVTNTTSTHNTCTVYACNLFTHGAPRSSQELVQKYVHSRIKSQDQMLHEPEVYLRKPKRWGCKISVCVSTQRLDDEHNRYHDADCD